VGLIGNHNPGYGNKILEESDIVFSLGCSLLQHQVGKDYSKFAPAAKIVYVNNDIKECKRAQLQFGKRLEIANLDISDFVKNITKFKKKKITIKNSAVENKIFYPVNHLVKILEEIKKTKDEAIIFSDAGATLSWTYQAANKVEKCPPIFTSFNLHSMGYANCAAIGAAVAGKKVYCIIGDGSIPMNSQEFAWLKKYSVKLIILDNNGYGIIRQTQKDFYHSKFFGSDFENNFSSLPKFSIEKIIKSFDIPLKKINKIDIGKRDIDWLNFSDKTRAIIIKIKYEARVTTA
jgi:acetolactate synthase-1/2/3 large subunit